MGKGGTFRKRELDCPAVDGRRLLCSVGFVVGEPLDWNLVHRMPGQSIASPFHELNRAEVYGEPL